MAIGEHLAQVVHLTGVEVVQVETSEARAVVEHQVHAGDVGSVEGAHVEVQQQIAVFEHAAHIGDLGCVPVGQVEDGEGFAAVEHAAHVGDLGGVPVAQVKNGNGIAPREHTVHVGHFGHIPSPQVEALVEPFATIEHTAHVGHLGRVEVGDARDGGQQFHVVEPVVGACRTNGRERLVEHNLSDVPSVITDLLFIEPCRVGAVHVQFTSDFPIGPRMCRKQVVIVKCHHIGVGVDDVICRQCRRLGCAKDECRQHHHYSFEISSLLHRSEKVFC